MHQLFHKLSVFVSLLFFISAANAGSFLLPVKALSCTEKNKAKTSAEMYAEAYDKAALVAIKSSTYMEQKGLELDDHGYNELAYRLIDKALKNVFVATTSENENKICLELNAEIDTLKADEIVATHNVKVLSSENIEEIVKEVNILYPDKAGNSDNLKPLIYIDNMIYFNGKKSSRFKEDIREYLSFKSEILITDKKELADYILQPHLLHSSINKIDEDKGRYNMSLAVEIQDMYGNIISSDRQNRYIIINKGEDTQQLAYKMMLKLLKEALSNLSNTFKNLQYK